MGSEMCIRDRCYLEHSFPAFQSGVLGFRDLRAVTKSKLQCSVGALGSSCSIDAFSRRRLPFQTHLRIGLAITDPTWPPRYQGNLKLSAHRNIVCPDWVSSNENWPQPLTIPWWLTPITRLTCQDVMVILSTRRNGPILVSHSN